MQAGLGSNAHSFPGNSNGYFGNVLATIYKMHIMDKYVFSVYGPTFQKTLLPRSWNGLRTTCGVIMISNSL
jgi:hypothetical protein